MKILIGHSNSVNSVVFSSNEEYLASGSCDKTTGLWRISNGELLKTLVRHSSQVRSVVFSPNGEYLISGSGDKSIGVWRV